jgi:hydroxyacyl-ACP dehydratase HTD2-like protein with hotdog domain
VKENSPLSSLAPGALIVRNEVLPTEVDLFMFSASTWLTHRIHFDRDYARSEGFEDIVVHGPFQGAYLSQLLSQYAKSNGGRLFQLHYRNVQPAYCSELLELSAYFKSAMFVDSEQEIAVDLEITNPERQKVAVGNAILRLPVGTQILEVSP